MVTSATYLEVGLNLSDLPRWEDFGKVNYTFVTIPAKDDCLNDKYYSKMDVI